MLDPGITAQDFEREVFEQQPYLRRGALNAPPAEWSELDELLHHLEPSDTGLQLFQPGLVPQATYTVDTLRSGQRRRALIKPRFYGHMRSGATLVLNRIEAHWLRAQALCGEVGAFTGMSTTANAYLSFGGRGSFGAHWDTHDVFAIQLIGRKRWRLSAPTFPLPLSQHRSQDSGHRPPHEPALDVVLETGDLLYVPRGWWHQVLPFDQASLHLSVGAYAPTVHDYLMWLASRLLPHESVARRGIGVSTPSAELAAVLDRLRTAAIDPASLAAFRRTLREHEDRRCEFDLERLAAPSGASFLAPEAILKLRGRIEDIESDTRLLDGVRQRLDPIMLAIIDALHAGPKTLDGLCACMVEWPRSVVAEAVLELARHDLLSISCTTAATSGADAKLGRCALHHRA